MFAIAYPSKRATVITFVSRKTWPWIFLEGRVQGPSTGRFLTTSKCLLKFGVLDMFFGGVRIANLRGWLWMLRVTTITLLMEAMYNGKSCINDSLNTQKYSNNKNLCFFCERHLFLHKMSCLNIISLKDVALSHLKSFIQLPHLFSLKLT